MLQDKLFLLTRIPPISVFFPSCLTFFSLCLTRRQWPFTMVLSCMNADGHGRAHVAFYREQGCEKMCVLESPLWSEWGLMTSIGSRDSSSTSSKISQLLYCLWITTVIFTPLSCGRHLCLLQKHPCSPPQNADQVSSLQESLSETGRLNKVPFLCAAASHTYATIPEPMCAIVCLVFCLVWFWSQTQGLSSP